MKDHFNETALIRAAVIAGDIKATISPAMKLADMQEVETLPGLWQPSIRQLQSGAERIRLSADIAETAAATADIGVACGTCHKHAGGPTVSAVVPPEAGDTVKLRMARHLWATERLWEGLYAPSDVAWNAAAKVLETDGFPANGAVAKSVQAKSLVERVSKLAKRAQVSKTAEARAAVYADFLGTCAPCHNAVRP